MGSVHNDLHTWACKARAQGLDTIEIDLETADRAAQQIVDLSNRVMDLEHERRAGGGGWMPIETAPKDSTEVIVLIREKVIRLGWYFKPSSRTEGWLDENSKPIRPSHWMPLPAPPALQPGGER